VIDSNHPKQRIDLVYPALIDLLEGKKSLKDEMTRF